jgi:ATP-binding cassette, subfamily B, bacterial
MILKLLLIVVVIFLCVKYAVKASNNAFPIILQDHIIQCGPVCLQMIAKYHGQNIELIELETLTRMNDNGTTILNLNQAAESIGFKSCAVKISFEELTIAPLPAIAHWNNNHFLVVYKANKDTVWVADPKSGKKIYTRKAFCDNWLNSSLATETDGVVLLLEKKH